jgi:hypothetical protein
MFVDEMNPITNAPDSLCLVMKDGTALVANAIEQHGKHQGTEVVLWKDGGVVSVICAVDGVAP